MRNILLMSAALFAIVSAPVQAQTLAVAGSGGFNAAGSQSAVATQGLAVGAAGGVGVSRGISAGVAVSTPLGSLSSGISQTNNFGAAGSGVIAGFGGAGVAGSTAGGAGLNVGGGFTLP